MKINKLLGYLELELNKKEDKSTHSDMPYIRYMVEGEEATEQIAEYGFNNRRFYVLTDENRLIYISDKATRKMIHYSDSSQIINLGGEIEKDDPEVNQNDIA